MNSRCNSDTTICSSSVSHTEEDLEDRDTVSLHRKKRNELKFQIIENATCSNPTNNANGQPTTSKNSDDPNLNVVLNDQTGPGIDKIATNITSQESSHSHQSVSSKSHSEEICDPTPKSKIKPVLEDTTSSISNSEDSITFNLVQTRSTVNNVQDVLGLRDERVRNEGGNNVHLDAIPESSRNSSTFNRSNFRENRIIKFYRSLRNSIGTDHVNRHTFSYCTTPSLTEAPPTYSSTIRGDNIQDTEVFMRRNVISVQQSPPFVAPRPPPTYENTDEINIQRTLFLSSIEEPEWSPEPIHVVCPRCSNLILTITRTRMSSINHISAVILCLCGCWPCCLVPYCIDSCKTTYHYCPNCRLPLGVYNPW